ncbi:MAG: hypothetical protein PHQ74_10445 [Crocinitomicaceae bacterium]|nr:hypothetical protein [Crocinitomicaceae bacterium]
MIRFYFTFLSLLTCLFVQSQGWQPAGSRSMSMANSTVALADVWSYHHNPAGLAFVKKTAAGLSYENRFLLKELQTQALVVAQPLKVGVLSAGAQMYGHRAYKTTRVGLGYSMLLGENISAGVQLNYQGIRIDQYGSKGTVTAEAGFLAKINSKVSLGFSVMNLGMAKLTEFEDDRFSTFMRLGLNYQISKKVIILAEVDKSIETKLRAKAGMEYELLDRFFLRMGVASNPTEITFGFGYEFKNRLKLDLGSAWHQHLGWSPHFGLTYEFLNKKHD